MGDVGAISRFFIIFLYSLYLNYNQLGQSLEQKVRDTFAGSMEYHHCPCTRTEIVSSLYKNTPRRSSRRTVIVVKVEALFCDTPKYCYRPPFYQYGCASGKATNNKSMYLGIKASE